MNLSTILDSLSHIEAIDAQSAKLTVERAAWLAPLAARARALYAHRAGSWYDWSVTHLSVVKGGFSATIEYRENDYDATSYDSFTIPEVCLTEPDEAVAVSMYKEHVDSAARAYLRDQKLRDKAEREKDRAKRKERVKAAKAAKRKADRALFLKLAKRFGGPKITKSL